MAAASNDVSFWVFLTITVTLSLTPVFSQTDDDDLFFRGFSGANITLDGAAEILDSGVLLLTNDTPQVLGHAVYSSPIQFNNSTGNSVSFSTAFAFAIISKDPDYGGHGLAFTISPTADLVGALPSQYLGLMNKTDVGNFSNHIFAVEFDTVQDLEFRDINGNHVGIDINSLVSNISADAGVSLRSGQVIQAWVDYSSVKNQLEVRISNSSVKPPAPILSFAVDLSDIFVDRMYVGFSASTGRLSSRHYLLGWSFAINKDARSLDLASLPKLPGQETTGTSTKFIIGISVGAGVLTLLVAAVAVSIIYRIRLSDDTVEAWELDIGPHRFHYRELKKATKGFSDKALLGFGGFGQVYKGTLPNSDTHVAVKRISNDSKQGLTEFISEIATIGRLRHRNLVQLLGWCRKNADLLIVYDFMPNGSLDKYLFDEPTKVLQWPQRFNIIKGVASGLVYLHEEWDQIVIHRDIKAGNVLLDGELNGRLGDFGLAKLYEHGKNPGTTRVVGTLGYLAPELTKTGKPTTSSDVYAFGAVCLEVVCGRRPVEPKALPEELILVDWVWDKWVVGAVLEVVDSRLGREFDEAEAVVLLKLGLLCSNNSPELRPTMREVVRYLEGELALPETVLPPDGNYVKKKDPPSEADEGTTLDNSFETSSYFEKVTNWSVDGEEYLPDSVIGDGR